MGSLPATEQETIIGFNRGERLAYIFTYEPTWIKHLEGKLKLKPLYKNGFGGREYEIDKSRIRMPQLKKQYSKETIARMKKRMGGVRQTIPESSENIVPTRKSARKGMI